jgi:hypothetical protein
VSAQFVSSLRSRRESIRLAGATGEAVTIRVQIPELWDVVRIETTAGATVSGVKLATLAALRPDADPDLFVIKLRGFEVLDENVSLADAGALDGSIFLLTQRRRRPVR